MRADVATVILWVGVLLLLCDYLYVGFWKKSWRWLKGPRISYYLDEKGELRQSSERLRTDIERKRAGVAGAVIEVVKTPFRMKATIYGGSDLLFLSIDRVKEYPSYGPIIYLKDSLGLTIEDSLLAINKYPAIQVLLNLAYVDLEVKKKRIAELEKDLAETRKLFSYLHADVEAVIKAVKNDKQRYRAPAALRMQHCLEKICLDSKAPRPDRAMVDYGAAIWKERLKLL